MPPDVKWQGQHVDIVLAEAAKTSAEETTKNPSSLIGSKKKRNTRTGLHTKTNTHRLSASVFMMRGTEVTVGLMLP